LYKKLDLTYVQRRRWPQSWRFWLSALAVVLSGGWIVMSFFQRGLVDNLPGPVAGVHAGFEISCAQCHSETPDRPGFLLHATDQACIRCHTDMPAHPDPSDQQFVSLATDERRGFLKGRHLASGCVQCHAEHKGRDHSLLTVADQSCTQCHADVRAYWPAHGTAPSSTKTLVKHVLPALMADPIQNRVESFEQDHPDWDLLALGRIDSTQMRFEHRIHLDPDYDASINLGSRYTKTQAAQLPVAIEGSLKNWLENKEREEAFPVTEVFSKSLQRSVTVMQCSACHVAEAEGRYMLPVTYQSNCKMCHPTAAHGVEVKAYADRRLSEIKVNLTKGVLPNISDTDVLTTAGRLSEIGAPGSDHLAQRLRVSIADELLKSPNLAVEMILKQARTAEEPPPPPCGADDAERLFEAKAELLKSMRKLVGESELGEFAKAKSCSLCHKPIEAILPILIAGNETDLDAGLKSLFNVARTREKQWESTDWAALGPSIPKTPRRWLPRSRFDHGAHKTMNCVDCHDALGKSRASRPPLAGQHWAGNTRDILIPAIHNCVQCHSSKSGVRHTCVTCHDFHLHEK